MKELLTKLAEQAMGGPVYDNPLFPPSPYYRFFRLLAAELKPKLSVELGVCGGGGSLHLALGHPRGKVIGVDFQYDHPEQIEHIKETCKNFHFWGGDSILSALQIRGSKLAKALDVDILFIDTDHTYDRTLAEFKAWRYYLSKNAVVCFDDLFRPGMEEAWNEIPGKKLRFDFLHSGQYPEGGGFGVAYGFKT